MLFLFVWHKIKCFLLPLIPKISCRCKYTHTQRNITLFLSYFFFKVLLYMCVYVSRFLIYDGRVVLFRLLLYFVCATWISKDMKIRFTGIFEHLSMFLFCRFFFSFLQISLIHVWLRVGCVIQRKTFST